MIDDKNNELIQKQKDHGIDIITFTRQGMREIYITAAPEADEKLSNVIVRLSHTLKNLHAMIVKCDIFCPTNEFSLCMKLLNDAYGQVDWPITLVEGGSGSKNSFAGIQIYAVSEVTVETIFVDTKPIARVFEDDFAKYCLIGNIFSNTPFASQEEQTWDILTAMEKVLKLVGMDMSNIVRTWFYNDNIITWYNKFNDVRNKFFKQKGLYDKLLPASTGVGGKNIAHAASIASAMAVQGKKNNCIKVQLLQSRLQNTPSLYGSSFSRALEIVMPDHRKIFISGTASIDNSGKTVYVDNINMQIAFTMEVLEAILMSRGMDFSDVTRAIIYFKYAKDTPAFDKYCKKNKKPALPAVIIQNDICRDNLLFEIEVDAISKI